MIRTLAIILALSTSFAALSAMEASAQVTEQTDKSEEDWRKSKKKRDTSDIFEDILNRRSIGQGNGTYPQNPIDSLPEESRRHLMKERAKVIAESDPGTSPDAPYSPSEAAKTDPELAEQEKEAWTVIMTDMKGGSSSGQGQPGTGPNKIAIAGQGGGQGDSQSQDRSVMRGGSSQSVADILAQIKGLKSAGGGVGGSRPSGSPSRQGPLGTGTGQQQGSQGQGTAGQGTVSQGASGQSPLGQGVEGQSQSQSQTGADAKAAQQAQAQAQAQEKADAAGQAAAEAQAQADSAAKAAQQAQAIAQAKGDATSQMKSEIANDIAQMSQAKADKAAQEAAQAKAEAQAQSAAKAQADAHTAAHAEAIEKAKQAPEPIGPLDRIKREREERPTGTQTSASDYLKRSK